MLINLSIALDIKDLFINNNKTMAMEKNSSISLSKCCLEKRPYHSGGAV